MKTIKRVSILLALLVSIGGGTTAAAQERTPAPADDLAGLSGEITIDGSSTVYPIADEAALRFLEEADSVEISIDITGTGGGFAGFCEGEADIQNASRPINAEEEQRCADNGVAFVPFRIAIDGITVVVNPANDFVSCLTVDQLRRLWQPDDPARTWQDLDPSWPDRTIDLYGPGPRSGTYDSFTSQIVGQEGVSRTDFHASESDLALVDGVAQSEDGLAFFGFSYYADAQDELKFVAIDAGNGCVAPTLETISDGSYQPLSRPLFIYVSQASLARPELQAFLRFSFAQVRDIVETVGYVPLSDAEYAAMQDELEAAIVEALRGG